MPLVSMPEALYHFCLALRRPLVVAGGGVHYSEATEALRAFAEATGIPVADIPLVGNTTSPVPAPSASCSMS